MFKKKTVKDIDVKNKHVLVRVDFNVPIKDGKVGDDTRIVAALPTIKYLLDQNAAVILCSHLGRPKGQPDPKYSLLPVAEYLGNLIKVPVAFSNDCVGAEAKKASEELKPGNILVLENTRFHAEEKDNDPEFAKELASLAESFLLMMLLVLHIVPMHPQKA